MNRLKEIILTMDIPDFRRDLSLDQNVRQLMRNLAINNSDHVDFDEALILLKAI